MPTLDFDIAPSPVAGEPVIIKYSVKENGETVTDLQKVHDRVSHLVILSKDLQFFDHVHADFDPDTGLFSLQYIFHKKGTYVLFADYTLQKTGNTKVERDEIKVQQKKTETNRNPQKRSTDKDDIIVHQQIEPENVQAGEDTRLTFRLESESGDEINDIEPYLGAPGHLIIISKDTKLFLHAHPDIAGMIHKPAGQTHNHHTSNEPTRFGPAIVFHTRFPTPGLYKLWLEFLRKGKLYRKKFEITVEGQ